MSTLVPLVQQSTSAERVPQNCAYIKHRAISRLFSFCIKEFLSASYKGLNSSAISHGEQMYSTSGPTIQIRSRPISQTCHWQQQMCRLSVPTEQRPSLSQASFLTACCQLQDWNLVLQAASHFTKTAQRLSCYLTGGVVQQLKDSV